jgi:predicted transcriptional regulator
VAKKTDAPQPTHAELEILGVLWRGGPATVREVHEQLDRRDVGYTTVLKLMQIMAAKRLVIRDERARSHVYRAAFPEQAVKQRIVRDLLDRAFEGSAAKLVMHALESRPASPDEIARIRSLLDSLDTRGDA